MPPSTTTSFHRHVYQTGANHNNSSSSIKGDNNSNKQGSSVVSLQYHNTAQKQDPSESNDNAVRLITLEGTTHDTKDRAATITTPGQAVAVAATKPTTPTSWNRDDDDEQLDPAEKERRRQARAFEQQQRILQQVEAARQANNKKKNNRNNSKRLIISTPTPHRMETKATAPSTTGKCIAGTKPNGHQDDVDKAIPAESRQHQRERPPRTKGLLYRRLPNGKLEPMEQRSWIGTTQPTVNTNNHHHHRFASNRTKPNI